MGLLSLSASIRVILGRQTGSSSEGTSSHISGLEAWIRGTISLFRCAWFYGLMAAISSQPLTNMKPLLFLLIAVATVVAAPTQGADRPIRVLLITGGHGYDTNEFAAMFKADSGIEVNHVIHPKAQRWFKPDRATNYDVLVSYDMWSEINAEAKADLLNLIRGGTGFLALHHCLASYPEWDDYARLIGGKYHLKPWAQNGRARPGSTFKHDVVVPVQVVARNHPVTRGVEDFSIHDEVYGGFEVKPDVTPLLRTEHPESSPVICWARQEGNGRVVYLQLGHDRLAYENPAFRRLVAQGIRYVAKRH
jgi:type 1 glutamine amidotransferase